MKTYKVSELSGVLLDMAVAVCEGWTFSDPKVDAAGHMWLSVTKQDWDGAPWPAVVWRTKQGDIQGARGMNAYSALWELAGPIIDRERMSLGPKFDRGFVWHGAWVAISFGFEERQRCEEEHLEPLVAAMRAYVGSVKGETVELPL